MAAFKRKKKRAVFDILNDLKDDFEEDGIGELQQRNQRLEIENVKLASDKQEMEKRRVVLETKIRELEADARRDFSPDSNLELEEYKGLIEKLTNENTKFSEEIIRLAKRQPQVDELKEHWAQEKESYVLEIAEHKKEQIALRNENKQLSKANQILHKETSQMSEETNRLLEENEQLSEENLSLSLQITELTQERQKTEETALIAQKSLQSMLTQERTENERLHQHFDRLTQQNQQLTVLVDQLTESAKQPEGTVIIETRAYKDLLAHIHVLENELSTLKNQKFQEKDYSLAKDELANILLNAKLNEKDLLKQADAQAHEIKSEAKEELRHLKANTLLYQQNVEAAKEESERLFHQLISRVHELNQIV